MRILVVDDDADIREVLIFFLEVQIEAEYLEAGAVSEAMQRIKNDAPDVILCDYHLDGEKGTSIYNSLQEQKNRTPFVLASGKNPEDITDLNLKKLSYFLPKPFNKKSIEEMIEKVVRPLVSDEKDFSQADYIPIRIERLLSGEPLPCDLYVRLSEAKFVRVLRAGDHFTDKDADHFNGKELDRLYVERDSVTILVRQITSRMLKEYSGNEVKIEELTAISADCLNTIRNITETLGFNEELATLTTTNVEIALNTLSKTPKVKELLDQRLKNPDQYLASHSLMLAHFACGLAKLMDWNHENQSLKLTSATLLHDIFLQNEHWEREGKTPKSSAFVDEDAPTVEIDFIRHISRAASMAKDIREIPNEVETIILEHHEKPDGSGFPKALNANKIGPLSSLFIFSHHFINYTFSKEKDTDELILDFLNEYEELYSSYHFRDIVTYLWKMATKKMEGNLAA